MTHIVCKLLALNCYYVNEQNSDLFLKRKGKKIWPLKGYSRRDHRGRILLDLVLHDITPGEMIVLQLWDYEFIGSNNLLGEFMFTADKPGGPFFSDMKQCEGNHNFRFTIEFELLKHPVKKNEKKLKLNT